MDETYFYQAEVEANCRGTESTEAKIAYLDYELSGFYILVFGRKSSLTTWKNIDFLQRTKTSLLEELSVSETD